MEKRSIRLNLLFVFGKPNTDNREVSVLVFIPNIWLNGYKRRKKESNIRPSLVNAHIKLTSPVF